jgi:SAM-dependent methyltransferase
MPKQLVKYKVFISSPSDVQEAREAAEEVIQEWNKLNSDKSGILFESLRWEVDASPNLQQSAQENINENLLAEADALIAIFWKRLGTPTENFPSGSVEEIMTAPESAKIWVYFCDREFSLGEAEQATAVIEFKKKLSSGLYGSYEKVDEFRTKLLKDLTTFADSLPTQTEPITLRRYQTDKGGFKGTLGKWHEEGKAGTILLYNVELGTFRNEERFRSVWGRYEPEAPFSKIILLLPGAKIRRLERHLRKFESEFRKSPISDRFYVCRFKSRADDSPESAPKGVAFAMFRHGDDPSSGNIHPRIQVFVLAEPFCEPEQDDSTGGEIVWDYKYAFNFHGDETIAEPLDDLWKKRFEPAEMQQVLELLNAHDREEKETDEFTSNLDYDEISDVRGQMAEIRALLRDRLFEPNVPSLFLNKRLFLLDWNSAFELVFPTQRFCRGQYVTAFLKCLENKDDALKDRDDFLDKNNKLIDDSKLPIFHIQKLIYRSPQYGEMKFTKMASKVEKPETGETVGWDIALNANLVDKRELYEEDLTRVNLYMSLLTRYALAYDRIAGDFAHYHEFVDLHCAAVAHAGKVLDLGSGPGYVAQRLLEKGKHVTAVDSNDAMLRCLERNCDNVANQQNLRVLKQNLEKLYSVDESEIGDLERQRVEALFPPYDGAVLMNVAHALRKPVECFKRIYEVLAPDGVLALSGPKSDTEIRNLFETIENEKEARAQREKWDKESIDKWNVAFEIFQEVNHKLVEEEFFHKYSPEDVTAMLQQAGFEVRDDEIRTDAYVGDWMFIVARRPGA